MGWWHKNNLRLIQNNIMETEATLDVDKLIEKVKYFNANVLMVNAGGIEAFYPTELEYHYRSPYLKGDLIGALVEKCHQEDIRFIARFDFSKIHNSVYQRHPDWAYKSVAGQAVENTGTIITCPNGPYQKECSQKIIEEVLTKYPVDGIFFNMFGFQTSDFYTGIYHGICQCDSCKTRFMQMFGNELPTVENKNDAVFRQYTQFKEIVIKEVLDEIHTLTKNINPEIAISTYTDYNIDIIRNESHSAIVRHLPPWPYSASENVSFVEGSWDDKVISNCDINAVDIPYRFVGVSEHVTRHRLYQNIASGSGLDFCILGAFEGYPDEENFDAVKEVFDYHQKNEQYYGNFTSAADVALLKSGYTVIVDSDSEYMGIFKMLKEAHVLFDVLCLSNMDNLLEKLGQYKLVILPGYDLLRNRQLVEAIREKGVSMIVTNPPEVLSEELKKCTNDVLGTPLESVTSQTLAAYLQTSDKTLFKHFSKRNWVLLHGRFAYHGTKDGDPNPLPFVTPGRFAPPERCGGNTVTDIPGLVMRQNEKSSQVAIPWQIGHLYFQFGYEDHKNVLLDVMDAVFEGKYGLVTNAPKNVEVFLNKYDGKNYILQLMNLTGFNGVTYFEPNPVYDMECRIPGVTTLKNVKSLVNDGNVTFEIGDQGLLIKIKKLINFEAVVIDI